MNVARRLESRGASQLSKVKYARLGLASLFLLALTLGVLGVAVVEYLPNFRDSVNLPACGFQKATGLYCPGCGATRALRRVLRGDLLGALRYNAFIVIFAPILAYLAAVEIYDEFRGTRPYRPSSKVLALIGICFYLAFFVLRNIPLTAFEFLRPPQ